MPSANRFKDGTLPTAFYDDFLARAVGEDQKQLHLGCGFGKEYKKNAIEWLKEQDKYYHGIDIQPNSEKQAALEDMKKDFMKRDEKAMKGVPEEERKKYAELLILNQRTEDGLIKKEFIDAYIERQPEIYEEGAFISYQDAFDWLYKHSKYI